MCYGNTKIEWPKRRGNSSVTGHVKQEGLDRRKRGWDVEVRR